MGLIEPVSSPAQDIVKHASPSLTALSQQVLRVAEARELPETHKITTIGNQKVWPPLSIHDGLDELFNKSSFFKITGDSLRIGHVISFLTGKTIVSSTLPESVKGKVEQSATALRAGLKQNRVVYGVNTGFGGSSDARTDQHQDLQHALIQMLNSGILTASSLLDTPSSKSHEIIHGMGDSAMPIGWVVSAMIVRANSLARGHSGIRAEVIQTILKLLKNNITPVIPMRGSISASGDLSPLSYLAAVLQGNPDVYAYYTRNVDGVQIKKAPADKVLESHGIAPVTLEAKEALALVNGTAVATGVAVIAIYDATATGLITQMLTAMATEALHGTAESFHPFIANARPHDGQVEVAKNILAFLQGSKLARGLDDEDAVSVTEVAEVDKCDVTPQEEIVPNMERNFHCENPEKVDDRYIDSHLPRHTLAQDRYSIRTASQWIGPCTEDFELAMKQVEREMNATTDNPLIDSSNPNHPRFFHGGNFQAASITSAMEKTRGGVQMLGKLMFAQCSEIINPDMNNGLPANLAHDSPSLNYCCKGLDINMAAYMSELSFLSNTMANHVQSAEMHNQAVNSLALISARMTVKAIDIANMMIASYLYVLCQAIDLRVARRLSLAGPPTPAQVYGMTGIATQAMYELVREKLGVPMFRGLQDAPLYSVGGEAGDNANNKKTIGTYVSRIYEACRSWDVANVAVLALRRSGSPAGVLFRE